MHATVFTRRRNREGYPRISFHSIDEGTLRRFTQMAIRTKGTPIAVKSVKSESDRQQATESIRLVCTRPDIPVVPETDGGHEQSERLSDVRRTTSTGHGLLQSRRRYFHQMLHRHLGFVRTVVLNKPCKYFVCILYSAYSLLLLNK